MTKYPDIRLRRLRKSSGIRNMLAQQFPGPERFVWPVFVVEGQARAIPIDAMPGQFRYSVDMLLKAVAPLVTLEIGGVMLFGVVEDSRKSENAQFAWSAEGPVQRAATALKKEFPKLTVFTDVCVCGYTSHGHCGILTPEGAVENDSSRELLTRMALSHAESGADAVAPSAMMDGQVSAIRNELDLNSFTNTILLSYSTKFASSMYGPFREAAHSAPGKGDRKTYQSDFRNRNLAIRESILDEQEGADMLMVKPSLFYLDIIAEIKRRSLLPLAAYNVSGEYSMIIASSERGWGDRYAMAAEALCALNRAGTDIFISYWANQYSDIFPD